jgi:hypothetical protein
MYLFINADLSIFARCFTLTKYNLYGFSTPLIGGRCWLSQIIASDNAPSFFPHIQTQTEII